MRIKNKEQSIYPRNWRIDNDDDDDDANITRNNRSPYAKEPLDGTKNVFSIIARTRFAWKIS